jgi:hypothetical protein
MKAVLYKRTSLPPLKTVLYKRKGLILKPVLYKSTVLSLKTVIYKRAVLTLVFLHLRRASVEYQMPRILQKLHHKTVPALGGNILKGTLIYFHNCSKMNMV